MSFDRIRKLIKNANASVDATTTEYGTENENHVDKKENEIMAKAKANANVTVNNANVKEEKPMKATVNKSTKAKENTMVTININGIQITCTQEQAIEIAKACAANETEEKSVKATVSKGTTKGSAKETEKSSTKTSGKRKAKNAPTTVKEETAKVKPATKKEAIKAKYGEEEVKSFGIAASEVRAEMMADNAKMLKENGGVYPKNYYVGSKWNTEFKRRMKARGFYQK